MSAVTFTIVLVHLHAARAEQLWDVIVTEEGRGNFETSSTAKGSLDVIEAEDRVTDNAMVIA